MRGTIWLSAVVGAAAVDVAPVQKVIDMLQGLQSKVVSEGTAEAKTYDSFACFCKDQSKAKNDAIADNENQITSLTAEMETQRGIRNAKDTEAKEFQAELADYKLEVANVQAEAKKRKEKYAIEITDMTNAVKALEDAIDVLKASNTTGALISMKSTLRTAAVMAQSLGFGNKMLMQIADIPEVPVSDYDFHSNDIIATVKELLTEFRKTKERVDSDEVTAVQETTTELQGLHDSIKATEKSLNDATAARAAAEEQIGSLSGDLTIATATLHDDQNYLKDLTDKCNQKSDLWNQRVAMRQGELVALTGALEALKGTVTESNKRTIRFTQTSFVQTAKEVRHHVMLNKATNSRGFLRSRDPREMVMELLRSKSVTLKSAVLASLASHAGADPLGKVKQLIEDLILKLQEEASEEANHHGWCVKQTRLAEEKRDMKAKAISKLNSRLAKSEAKRDKLDENIEKLSSEIGELEDSLAKQTQIRDEEKAENDSVIADAQAGNAGVQTAIQILDRFYKEAAKGGFVQTRQGPTAEDIPDAGFDEEYTGSQDDNVGVLGMLDVIKSDFVRTEEETKQAEKDQAAAFLEFKTTTNSSLAEKNNAKQNYSDELTATKESITKDGEDMGSAQTQFDSAIAELIELHAACVDTGMSYEERVARREDEVEALKDAYKILDGYTPQ